PPRPPTPTPLPPPTLFRSKHWPRTSPPTPCSPTWPHRPRATSVRPRRRNDRGLPVAAMTNQRFDEFGYVSHDPVSGVHRLGANRSEEHTSELQSRENLVCR